MAVDKVVAVAIGVHRHHFYFDDSPESAVVLPEVLADVADDPELPHFTEETAAFLQVQVDKALNND